MAESSPRTAIIAAVITVTGSITVALIANWDKFSDSPKHVSAPASQAPASIPASTPAQSATPSTDRVVPVINIAGVWRDPDNPANGSRITQEGNSFRVNSWGVVPQGIPFESAGSGTIAGQDVETTYTMTHPNGLRASGTCSGQVSRDGSRMTSKCSDNVLGTFVVSGVR